MNEYPSGSPEDLEKEQKESDKKFKEYFNKIMEWIEKKEEEEDSDALR